MLVLPPSSKPVCFVVKGLRWSEAELPSAPPETLEEATDYARFFYEEHSCPTNWLFEPEAWCTTTATPIPMAS